MTKGLVECPLWAHDVVQDGRVMILPSFIVSNINYNYFTKTLLFTPVSPTNITFVLNGVFPPQYF